MSLKPYVSKFWHFALQEKSLNVLIHLMFSCTKVVKSSKIAIYYLCNQPFHFSNRAVRWRMNVIVQSHYDVGMSHDVL